METRTETSSLATVIANWWRTRREEQRALSELLSLPSDTLAELAADCGVSADTLVALTRAGPHAADEMNAMMAILGIDPIKVQEQDRSIYSELKLNCARCGQKSLCRRSLADGSAYDNFGEFCRNADTMAELTHDVRVHLG